MRGNDVHWMGSKSPWLTDSAPQPGLTDGQASLGCCLDVVGQLKVCLPRYLADQQIHDASRETRRHHDSKIHDAMPRPQPTSTSLRIHRPTSSPKQSCIITASITLRLGMEKTRDVSPICRPLTRKLTLMMIRRFFWTVPSL